MNSLNSPRQYQLKRERALSRVIQAIRSSLDLETIFVTAVNEIGLLLQVDHVKISQHQPNQKLWLTVAHYRKHPDLPLSVGQSIPDEGNEVTAQLKRSQIVRIEDTNLCEDEVSRNIARTFPGAWLILPLHFHSEVWGSLCLLIDGRPHSWQEEEVELASMIGDQLAIAIEQAQLYEKMHYQVQREQTLNRVTQAVRNSLDLETVFSTAVDEIGKLLQVERSEIVQYLPERKLWLVVAERCHRSDLPKSLGLEIPDEGNPLAARLKQLEIVRIDDTKTLEDEFNRDQAQTYPGAWLLVPLHFRSSLWGSLTLTIESRPHHWRAEEVELACAVADQLALAIFQAQLYQQVQQLAEAEIFKALQRERELSEAKSRFIAMTSHDLRTPLTTIQSSVDLLGRYPEQLSSERHQDHLTRISSAVTQMNSMIQDVLLLSEAEAGQLQFNPAPVDLVQLCRHLIADLQVGDKKQHSIAFTVSEEREREPSVLDEKLVRYILTNLLVNASKYSPVGSTVRFDLKRQSDQAIFQIQDRGIGIPQEELSRIFETFYRATNAGTFNGTGLGLAIAKQCADLHGGQIAVDSVVGEGTTFTVTLPSRGSNPQKKD